MERATVQRARARTLLEPGTQADNAGAASVTVNLGHKSSAAEENAFMYGEHHALIEDFPDWQETIHRLKVEDSEFARLMREYNRLTKEIEGLEARDEPVTDEYMEARKRERVHLKDRLYEILQATR